MEKQFIIMLDKKAANLICTFIRRSIFEQYERNMSEAGFTPGNSKLTRAVNGTFFVR